MFAPIWKIIAHIAARPAVADWLIRRAQRTPYSPIIKNGDLYMDRFWLFNPYPDTGESGADKPRWTFPISIRIHHIVLPDQDRHLHDHPWNARTVVLRGWYNEIRLETPALDADGMERIVHAKIRRAAGDTAPLGFGEFHCITELPAGGVWTMFITGRYRGTWGFMVDGAKVPYRDYLGLPAKAARREISLEAARRASLIEVGVIYGAFIALAVWNWW